MAKIFLEKPGKIFRKFGARLEPDIASYGHATFHRTATIMPKNLNGRIFAETQHLEAYASVVHYGEPANSASLPRITQFFIGGATCSRFFPPVFDRCVSNGGPLTLKAAPQPPVPEPSLLSWISQIFIEPKG